MEKTNYKKTYVLLTQEKDMDANNIMMISLENN